MKMSICLDNCLRDPAAHLYDAAVILVLTYDFNGKQNNKLFPSQFCTI